MTKETPKDVCGEARVSLVRRKKAAAQKTRGNGARNSKDSVKKLE